MPLIKVLEHVSVTLDEDLGVLLPMAQLFITVSLYTLQEVRHEGSLFLDHLILDAFIFLLIFFELCKLLKLFQLVSQVFEVGSSIIILCREMFLFHGSVLGQLFGAAELFR